MHTMRRKCEFTMDSIQVLLNDELLQWAGDEEVRGPLALFTISRFLHDCEHRPVDSLRCVSELGYGN